MERARALIIYWSATGNTAQVAEAIRDALRSEGLEPAFLKVADAESEELYDYELIFLGCPSYSFQPPEPVLRYVKAKMRVHRERGDIKIGAPVRPGKNAVIFVTYSGPHTGIREATPVGAYLGQFFEHLGIPVADEWYVIGAFHNRPQEYNLAGRLGDIRGRPNEADLAEIRKKTVALWCSLQDSEGE